MGLIQKIRSQSTLIIGSIGVAMILFMLGGDFLTSSAGYLNGGVSDVGEIAGKTISYKEFETRVESEIATRYNGQPVDERTRESIRNSVWNDLMNEYAIYPEYNRLGLSVSPEEVFYQIKSNNPSPILTQYFTNPQTGRVYEQLADELTGQLSPDKLMYTVKQLISNPQGEAQWLEIESAIKQDRYATKYFNLIKKGMNITTAEAKDDFITKNRKISFSYVVKNYEEIVDDQVKIEDADLKAYYEDHKHEVYYKQNEPSRVVHYVSFPITPSDYDVNKVKEEISLLKDKFAASTDDTLFLNENSDAPVAMNFFTEKSFNPEVDSLIFNGAQGSVVGPYLDGSSYKLSKVLGRKSVSDSVKARHILIKINNGDTAKAQARVDSIQKVIKSKKNFEDMAKELSTDVGSAQEGGDLGWFTEGAMVKPFEEACFGAKVGDIKSVVTQFGVHLIEVTDKTIEKSKVQVATLEKIVAPGKETINQAFNLASTYSINNSNTNAFMAAANELGLRVADNVREGDKNFPGIESSRELIRWAYQAEVGAVSEPFEFDNQFVVLHLSEVKEKGVLPFTSEQVAVRVRAEVLKEKKAEMIKQELGGATTLEDAASKLGKTVMTVDDFNFSFFSVPGVGGERKLIGIVSTLAKGQVSAPIADGRGVYIVRVDNITDAPADANFALNKEQLAMNIQRRVDYEAYEALKDASGIIDNRVKFY